MQKILLHLLKHRIHATIDRIDNGYITENRLVYQAKLKLYKGVDNTFELEIKNSDQRRTQIAGSTVTAKFFDATHKKLFEVAGTPILSKTGIVEVTIPADTIELFDPQQLSMAAFLTDSNDIVHMLYSDSQFGVLGAVQLYDGYNEKYNIDDVIDTITRFNYDYGTSTYISEITEFGTTINNDIGIDDSVSVDIYNSPHAYYEGRVTVQACINNSLALGNKWDTIAYIDIFPFDGSTIITSQRIYKTIDGTDTGESRNYRFLRFYYDKPYKGMNAKFTVTRSNGDYAVVIATGGSNYNIGDRILIKGSDLDGISPANDLILTVTAINSLQVKKTISAVSVEGVAVLGDGLYHGMTGTNFTGVIDKIVIKN